MPFAMCHKQSQPSEIEALENKIPTYRKPFASANGLSKFYVCCNLTCNTDFFHRRSNASSTTAFTATRFAIVINIIGLPVRVLSFADRF